MSDALLRNKIALDVREDIRAGREPFSAIMAAVARLQGNDSLLITAPFEPKPLLLMLAKQGFGHHSQQMATGDWQVLFSRTTGTPATLDYTPVTSSSNGDVTTPTTSVVDLDARGLEPPQPLVTILEAIAELPPGTTLRAQTDRRPMHLYAQLEQRGFTGESQEQPDGSYLTHIRHR